ncbi:hypothetical protein J6590_023691 [Homalodisca vitripennis]|nr:hypothetical protein J6590_023691 [Homalodisca vitripennis]
MVCKWNPRKNNKRYLPVCSARHPEGGQADRCAGVKVDAHAAIPPLESPGRTRTQLMRGDDQMIIGVPVTATADNIDVNDLSSQAPPTYADEVFASRGSSTVRWDIVAQILTVP